MGKMRFVDRNKMNPDMKVNIAFRMCPMHLLKLDEALKKVSLGDTIEIVTTYDGALDDIPAWCHKTGNEFVGIDEDSEDRYYLYVRKKNDWEKNLPGSRCDYACVR